VCDQPRAVLFEKADAYVDSTALQPLDAAARDIRVRVDAGDDDPDQARGDDGVDARRGAAVVVARLEGALGYPVDEAARIAVATIIEQVAQDVAPFRVRFVLFGPATLDAYLAAARALTAPPKRA
jgi:hypothetical protein